MAHRFWTTHEHPAGCSKRPDFSPSQPWRAKMRLIPNKAAAPRLTLVSRFTPHVSRFLGTMRERSCRAFSAACQISCSLRHTSYSLTSLRDAGSGLPPSGPKADSSSVADGAHVVHGHIVDRPPNHHIRPDDTRRWVDARPNLPHILIIDSLGVCYTCAIERMLTRTEEQA